MVFELSSDLNRTVSVALGRRQNPFSYRLPSLSDTSPGAAPQRSQHCPVGLPIILCLPLWRSRCWSRPGTYRRASSGDHNGITSKSTAIDTT